MCVCDVVLGIGDLMFSVSAASRSSSIGLWPMETWAASVCRGCVD